MDRLATLCNKHKIVGFGEPQHWVTNPQIYRIELFKKLHTKYGWNYFLTETNLFVASMIDSYINGFMNSSRKLCLYLMNSFCLPEMFEFIEWARKQNETLPLDKRIHILGWDCQEHYEYKKHRPTKKKLVKNFSKLVKIFFRGFNLTKIKKLYTQMGKIDYDFVTDDPNLKYCNTRDKYVFYVMREFIRVLPKNENLFLIGHNGHLVIKKYENINIGSGPTCTRIGYYLHKNYKYLSIGSDILSGRLISNANAQNWNMNGTIIMSRKEKQSSAVRVINVIKTTQNITASERSDQRLMLTSNYHHILVRFKKDIPWTYKLSKIGIHKCFE